MEMRKKFSGMGFVIVRRKEMQVKKVKLKKMENKSRTKSIIIAIFIISLVVFVFNFPLKLSSGETCLLHKFIGSNATCEMMAADTEDSCSQKMMHRYLKPFAFLWWASLVGMSYSLSQLIKK